MPPTGEGVLPPIETRPQSLPFSSLHWEDFERLCLRVLASETELVHTEANEPRGSTAPDARLYGKRGQAQAGIDVFSRDPLPLGTEPPKRRYVCLQSRRIRRVTKTGSSKSVSDFLKGPWAAVSGRRTDVVASSPTPKR